MTVAPSDRNQAIGALMTVAMMMIWFVACFTPLVPHVANATHAVGLALGMAWGYLSSLRYR